MTTHAVIITYLRDQTQPAVDAIGGFYRTCVLTGKALVRRPFHWHEAIEQGWFITSVSLLPTLAVSIPLTVLIIFTLNILLAEFGAADISGAGAALGAVTQLGPLTTVLVIAGAGATAICATWVPAPSGKRSMRWRCWASTPSTGWWCLGSLPRPSSPHCLTAR